MINQQLSEYIRSATKDGIPKSEIAKSLIAKGWAVMDINAAFQAVESGVAPVTATMQTSPLPQPVTLPPTTEAAASAVMEPTLVMSTPKKHYSGAVLLLLLVVILGAGASAAYAFRSQIMLYFSGSKYSEQNLLSGLLAKASAIQSASYQVSGTLSVEPRDADAKPFTVQAATDAALVTRYANDAQRARDVESILGQLDYSQKLPATLDALKSKTTSSYSSFHTTDPLSQKPYGYTLTNGGKDFALTVTFETPDAITHIKNGFDFSTTTTTIQGSTVTFTKKSDSFIYLSSTPPKPFFVGLQDMANYLPAQMSATFSLSAATDWSKEVGDWKFNINATGDFSDLSYKFDADALRKDDVYYIRVNNIPGLFGSLALYKGQWIKIDPKAPTSTDPYSLDELSYAAEQIPSAESSYKKNKEELTKFLIQALSLADKDGVVYFKNPPHADAVDGRALYRYDLAFKKEAILPFYKDLAAAAASASPSIASSFDDEGMINYLQSKEFNEVFDYYNANTALTLWTDDSGYPAQVEYAIRFVPPDTNTALKDKQAKLDFKLTLSGVNAPVTIDVPTGAKSIQDIVGTSTPSK